MQKTPNFLRARKQIIKKIIRKSSWLNSKFFYTHTDEGMRLQSMLSHKPTKGYPKVKCAFTKEISPTKQDLVLTKRLLVAYKKALRDQNGGKSNVNQDIWSYLEKGPHTDFINLLHEQNVEKVAFALCNMTKNGISEGIAQGASEYEKINTDSTYRHWLGIFNLDKLITLAEALGVITYEDPEQGESGLAIFSNIDNVVKKIEDFLHISIIPPNIEGSLYKLVSKRGGIHNRDLTSLYTAWRCKELLNDRKNPNVCEIGGGIGKAAYYAHLLGIKNYTLIDLPQINVLQGFYLIKCLPSANVVLYGEPVKNKERNIVILPDWTFKNIQDKTFDLTLNQDSFPEIHKDIVMSYLKQIQLNTTDFFLSINQESQNTMMVGKERQNVVFELISKVKSFKRIYRFPYWMREGYVEELYNIKS